MRVLHWSATIMLLAAVAWTSVGIGADRHGDHMAMAAHSGPTEAGQGAFAAIAEIVAILEADPETDWSKVDISSLRHHLLDMSALTLAAQAAEQPVDGGLKMEVSGEGRAREAIQRMVPAHAAELDKLSTWSASADANDSGATLVVTSSDLIEQAKIRGLGFFGLMATGSHHQAHHLAMAKGLPMSQHQ